MLRQLAPAPPDQEYELVDLEPGPRHVPGRTLLAIMFGGLVIWWALGVSAFIQNLLVVPLLLTMFVRGRLRVPRTFIWWLLFMMWVALSASQVDSGPRWASYLLRTGLYVAATILFLYIYNAPRKALPSRTIVNILAVFWVLTTIGGMAGMIAPDFDFTTPLEAVLPQEALKERFVRDLVHASNASPQAFLGTSIRRPRAPHWTTNHWGAFYGMTLPFAVAAVFTMRSRLWRGLLIATVAGSIFPLVFSFNRGAWGATGGTMILAVARMAGSRGRSSRYARMLVVVGVVVGVVFISTPLVDLVVYRVAGGGFVDTRESYIKGAFSAADVSPILGFGTTIDATEIGLQPRRVALGSNGQFWTVLVSQGYPGLLFYVAFFVLIVVRTWRMVPATGGRDPTARFWAHISIVAAVLQMPLYELIPWGTIIVMIAAAIALREARPAYVRVPVARTDAPVDPVPEPVAGPLPPGRAASPAPPGRAASPAPQERAGSPAPPRPRGFFPPPPDLFGKGALPG